MKILNMIEGAAMGVLANVGAPFFRAVEVNSAHGALLYGRRRRECLDTQIVADQQLALEPIDEVYANGPSFVQSFAPKSDADDLEVQRLLDAAAKLNSEHRLDLKASAFRTWLQQSYRA